MADELKEQPDIEEIAEQSPTLSIEELRNLIVEQKDIRGGFQIVTAVPAHSETEGRLLLYKDSAGSGPWRLYARINSGWRLIGSTQFLTTVALDDLSDVVITSVAQGQVLYFNGTNWVNLAVGTNRYTLQTGGAGANPSWAPSPQSVMTAQGDILYASAANTLARLAPGTSGQFLQTQGASANPQWASPGVRLISSFHAEAAVVNTTTETNLMSFTLNGGSLGTTGILWGRIFIGKLDAQNGGGGQTLTISVYYGATSVSDTVQIDATTTNRRGFLEFWILGTGATGTQDLDFRLHTFPSEKIDNMAALDAAFVYGFAGGGGTAAIDSTVNQTVKITAQWGAALTANDIRGAYGFALLLTI